MPVTGFAIYVANGSSLWQGSDPPPDLSFLIPIAIASARDCAKHAAESLARVVGRASLTIEPLPSEASHVERRRIRRCLDAARAGDYGQDIQNLVIEARRLVSETENPPDLPPHAQPKSAHHRPIKEPSYSSSDEDGSGPAVGNVDAESRDASTRIRGRPQLIGLLKKAEERLRLLATVEQRGADWFLAIGEAFEHFPGIYHGLGTIGFLTEAQELIRGRDKVLQAVAPVVVSGVSEHGPKGASELAQVLGIPADSGSEAIERATAAVVDAALETADRIAEICQWVQATPAPIPDDVYQTESDGASGAPSAAAATSSTPPGVDPLALAALARKTADRIRKVPYQISHILNSDPLPKFRQVREQLEPLKISIDFLPVVTYVERNWTPAHAQALAGQIHKVTETVESFLSFYQAVTSSRDTLIWRREENARFLVLCLLIAQQVAQWAAEIEDRARREGRLSQRVNDPGALSAETVKPWEPPAGYVGRKAICNDARFQKGGKNPSPTTIDVWVKATKRDGQPIKIEKARDTGENHYPEAWVRDRIRCWNPRRQKRNQ